MTWCRVLIVSTKFSCCGFTPRLTDVSDYNQRLTRVHAIDLPWALAKNDVDLPEELLVPFATGDVNTEDASMGYDELGAFLNAPVGSQCEFPSVTSGCTEIHNQTTLPPHGNDRLYLNLENPVGSFRQPADCGIGTYAQECPVEQGESSTQGGRGVKTTSDELEASSLKLMQYVNNIIEEFHQAEADQTGIHLGYLCAETLGLTLPKIFLKVLVNTYHKRVEREGAAGDTNPPQGMKGKARGL